MVYSRHNTKQNLLSALKYKDKESLKDIIASYIAKNVTINHDKVVGALNSAGIKASATESTPSLIDKVVKNIGSKGLVKGISVLGDAEMNFTGSETEAQKALPDVDANDLADIKKRANEMTGNASPGMGNAKRFLFWTGVTILGLYLISNIKSTPKAEEGAPLMPDVPATDPVVAVQPITPAAPVVAPTVSA